MKPLRVVILHQALSAEPPPDELDVLDEVRAVRAALKALGHRATVLPMTAALDDMRLSLMRARPDCVFNLVETLLGCGALAPSATALLDASRIAYTGASTAAMALTTNKLTTKRALRRAGISTPAWVTPREQVGFKPGTYVIKPISEDASVGLDEDSVVGFRSLTECQREVSRRSEKMGRALFAERFIEGREFNISLIGTLEAPRVLPIAEILFHGFKERRKPTVVGYRAKWDLESFEYQNTTRSFAESTADRALHRALSRIAKMTWTVVGCGGYGRVDLRVNRSGTPYVLEVNANPCIAPDAGFSAAANQAGMTYPETVAAIVRVALGNDAR
jgi:D-alanine-D-alanine ligase